MWTTANSTAIWVWVKRSSLPQEETEERWRLTTPEWPMMHMVMKGITRDQFMARHKANHIQVVYAPDKADARKALYAKAAALNELGINVSLCGKIIRLEAAMLRNDHVALPVSDMDEAIKFYAEKLGLAVHVSRSRSGGARGVHIP